MNLMYYIIHDICLKSAPNYILKSFVQKIVCHYLAGDMGGGGRLVTNGDMGGGGPKNAIFAVTSFLNGPLSICF